MCDGRVLLVDQDDATLRPTAEILESAGYQCQCARDGNSAMERLKREHYDAVIAEIRIPGNERLELVRELQRYAAGPPVPVILLTGSPTAETAIEALGLSVVAYLVKPAPPELLREKTKQAVALSRIQRDIRSVRKGYSHAGTSELVSPSQVQAQSASASTPASPVAGAFVSRTLANISASLADLSRVSDDLLEEIRSGPKNSRSAPDCERCAALLPVIEETIAVLARSAGDSSSPELPDLKQKLEAARKRARAGHES